MGDLKPKYVKCPETFEPLFAQAEQNLLKFFTGLKQNPEKGEVSISDERYILARASTFSVQLQQILEKEYGNYLLLKLFII